jgi:mRNA interferase HigB
VHVVSQKRIREAVARLPQYESALLSWYRLVKMGSFDNYAALRNTFPGVDKVGKVFVFNVAGNHLRIIAAVHFNRSKVYIRDILTHSEYDEQKWKRY